MRGRRPRPSWMSSGVISSRPASLALPKAPRTARRISRGGSSASLSCAEVPIDASGAVWLATANDAARIPEPLLSRLSVYEIEAPDAEGSRRIATAIYREVRETHDWGRAFPEALGASAHDRLAELPPREMRRAVLGAFGNAKLEGRDEITPADIQDGRGRKPRIGF